MIFKRRNKPTEDNGLTMVSGKLSFAATEAYKLLRTNVMFTVSGGENSNECRIIGLTSPMREEGKSTTAVNLSYALAEAGRKVLLIDADMRLPSVAKKLDIRSAPGLSNVLAGTVSIETAVWTSDKIDGWDVLPAGDIPPNPAELLGSVHMTKLLKQLSSSYDFIILDFPPVNIVSDALAVSPLIDGMIVVIRENYSGRRELSRCMRQLKLSEVKVLGFVVTTVEESALHSKYKYGRYGKKYGRYYSAQVTEKPQKEQISESEDQK